jgi:hypothetical protein
MDYIYEQHKLVVRVESNRRPSGSQLLLKIGLKRLLDHQWFTRVWVLQEIANARTASIVCGWKSVSAQTFAIIPALLDIEVNEQCRAVLEVMPGGSRKNSWWSKDRSLYALLKRFRISQATEQQDRIYALLSMSSDAYGCEMLIPDYAKDLKKIIQETTSFILTPKSPTILLYNYIQWTWEEFWQNLEYLSDIVLVHAIRERDIDGVELILKQNDCKISWQDSNGRNALSLAAQQGDNGVFKLLMESGKVDVYKLGHTLSWEVENGHGTIIKLLEETSKVDLDKWPLSWEVKDGHDAIIKLLDETGKVDLDK